MAFISSVQGMSIPCSPLWQALVTSKNSFSPSVTCHSASSPTSRISGTSVTSLGHAATEGGGVDVHDPRAPQRFGQCLDLSDNFLANDGAVVGQLLLFHFDLLEHGDVLLPKRSPHAKRTSTKHTMCLVLVTPSITHNGVG